MIVLNDQLQSHLNEIHSEQHPYPNSNSDSDSDVSIQGNDNDSNMENDINITNIMRSTTKYDNEEEVNAAIDEHAHAHAHAGETKSYLDPNTFHGRRNCNMFMVGFFTGIIGCCIVFSLGLHMNMNPNEKGDWSMLERIGTVTAFPITCFASGLILLIITHDLLYEYKYNHPARKSGSKVSNISGDGNAQVCRDGIGIGIDMIDSEIGCVMDRNMNVKDKDKDKNKNKDQYEYRERILKALGSIRAPPLVRDRDPKSIHINVQVLQQITALAECHAALMGDMEHALEKIRTVSSIRLGLGPFSPVVDRVEHSSHGSKGVTGHGHGRGRGRGRGRASLGGQRMRRILFQSMKEQNESLWAVMGAMSEVGDGSGDNDDDDDNDEGGRNDWTDGLLQNAGIASMGDTPASSFVLTVHLLNRCLYSNGIVLSKLLTASFSATGSLDNDEGEGEDDDEDDDEAGGDQDCDCDAMMKIIEASINSAHEQRAYLGSCFCLDLDEQIGAQVSTAQEMDNRHQSSLAPVIELQNHVDAAGVVLLAFVKSLQTIVTVERTEGATSSADADTDADASKTGEGAEHEIENISEEDPKALWNDFLNTLRNASQMCQSLQESLFRDDTSSDEEESDNDTSPDEEAHNCNQDPTEYDDEGTPMTAVQKRARDPDRKSVNKTLVFSGNGSKPKLTRLHKRVKSSTPSARASILCCDNSSSFQDLASRSFLLKELQLRLGAIELPEELETTSEPNGERGGGRRDRIARSGNKAHRPAKLFGGITGNVLMELKDALATKTEGIDEDSGHWQVI